MNRHIAFLFTLFLFLIGSASLANAQDAAVPASSKLREANKLIQEIYGHQLKAAQTGPQKIELAKTIQSDASKDNLAQYYSLHSAAIELACEAGDSALIVGFVDELDDVFEIDREEMSIDALSDCVNKARGADRDRVATDLSRLLDTAMQSGDAEYMKQLASLGYKMASRAKNRELAQHFKDAKKKIAKLANQNKAFESATVALAINPTDTAANQIMGQHYCFLNSQWSEGLEYLAKADGDIQSIAKADLANPTGAQEQLELARKWATYANQSKDYQNSIRLRARHWYLQSVSKLDGIKKRQVQAELDDLEISAEDLLRPRKMEKYVITSSDDNTIRVWDPKSGIEKFVIDEVHSDTRAVSMSPEGKIFASGSTDNIARIWSLETGKLLFKTEMQSGDVGAVDFSPDGKWLASGNSSGQVYILNAKTGKQKAKIELKSRLAWCLDWKPDGSQIAVAMGDGSIHLIDPATEKTQKINAHKSHVRTVRYSPNGKRLISGGTDKTVKMWNPVTAQTEGTITAHDRTVTCADFSPDGNQIVTASDDYKIRIWTQDGKPLHELSGHKSHVVTVRFSPSGRLIASCSWDDSIILWDAKTGKRLNTFEKHSGNVWGLDFGF